MYVHLELENGNAYPQRVPREEPPPNRARARARSGYRVFLVLLIVVLTVVLALEVAGSAYEAEVRPDAGSVVQPDVPEIDPGSAPELPGTSLAEVHKPVPSRISGGGDLPVAR